jgi:NAD(P)-dependent dehydrogenase (short-subunit alcohol dehydrogenase family)
MNCKGKYILVTGSAVRIGAEIVKVLAKQGAFMIIHYNQSKDAAEKLFEEIGGKKKQHQLVQCDLSIPEAVRKAFINLYFDILINNASVFELRDRETPDEKRRQMQINYGTPLFLMEILYKNCFSTERRNGMVLNLLDQAIYKKRNQKEPLNSYYTSKKLLEDATLYCAKKFAPLVQVNGIALGPVLPPTWCDNNRMENVLKEVPLGRPVEMKDLLDTVLFTLKNSSLTGTIIYLDGGQHLF